MKKEEWTAYNNLSSRTRDSQRELINVQANRNSAAVRIFQIRRNFRKQLSASHRKGFQVTTYSPDESGFDNYSNTELFQSTSKQESIVSVAFESRCMTSVPTRTTQVAYHKIVKI